MVDNTGLTDAEASKLLNQVGPNELPEAKPDSLLLSFVRQFHNPVIYILLFALAFDLAVWWQEGLIKPPLEAITILLILLFNAVLGVWQERKSEAALSRLKALAAPKSWVMRDGELQQIASAAIVPGDLLRIEAGERIPADARATSVNSFSVDESVVTGESLPLEKSPGDPLLAGTLAVRGKGWMIVTATGEQSNMGQLAQLLRDVKQEPTPLERRLTQFGRKVAWAVIALALTVMIVGLWFEGVTEFNRLLLFAVALAVAAVPESLPAVLTLAMAMGMERMAKRKAVVRKLTAVEALGSVTVIATDKTGTLTENQMRVESVDAENQALALHTMVVVNDADALNQVGDPLELGLLRFAEQQGCDVQALQGSIKRIREKPFDAAWKYMQVTVEEQGECISYFKGAPEILLAMASLTESQKQQWLQRMEQHAAGGYRMLALACQRGDEAAALEWIGLVLLWDPPREEVPAAIAQAQAAGVRIIMITGDHPATAKAIADRVGIREGAVVTGADLEAIEFQQLQTLVQHTAIFARVKPEHKLAIVEALQSLGQVVAVTGDGVNDAPALKAADVGIAMGKRGSDVSREVADLVLLDDNFSTIVSAIEEGRSIYENIQKFIRTLFSTNVSETLVIVVGALIGFWLTKGEAGLLLPLTAAQILWINLLTDSLPALAITTDRNAHVLSGSPRDSGSPLLDRPSLIFVFGVGIMGAMLALLLYLGLYFYGSSHGEIQTAVFCFLVFVQLSFVLPARRVTARASFNPWVWLALSVAVVAQLMALLVTPLGRFLSIHPLTPVTVYALGTALLVAWFLAEGIALWLRRRNVA